MRDSLLSRFRGAFLGALIGEVVGVSASHQHSRLAWQQIFQGQLTKEASIAIRPNQNIRRMFELTSGLINAGGHAAKTTEQNRSTEPADLKSENQLKNPISSVPIPEKSASEAIVLSALPLALFYHDQPLLYRTALQTAGQSITENKLVTSALAPATIMGQAISLILRERFARLELIPQILKDLDLEESVPDLANQLQQVQIWIEQNTDLANVARYVKQAASSMTPDPDFLAVMLALYGFLYTPDDFRLSILRVSQLHSSLLLPTLTGAISGLYNGVTGLPRAWRQQVWLGEVGELNQCWGVASEAKVEEFADRLLACWSGATNPTVWLQQPQFNRITAAPRAIRLD